MALAPGKTYYEIIETLWSTLCHVFDNLKVICREQLAYIRSIYPYQDLLYPREPLIIDFKEGVKILKGDEQEQEGDELSDLSCYDEKRLGELVKEKYGSDIFVLDKYPANVRPFYTMPAEDPRYSNSFDVILRGQEISSGSQRIHDYQMLLNRLTELKFDPGKFRNYLDSFKYGSRSHGGLGIGIERTVMLYLDLDNIRETSLYPRDRYRVIP